MCTCTRMHIGELTSSRTPPTCPSHTMEFCETILDFTSKPLFSSPPCSYFEVNQGDAFSYLPFWLRLLDFLFLKRFCKENQKCRFAAGRSWSEPTGGGATAVHGGHVVDLMPEQARLRDVGTVLCLCRMLHWTQMLSTVLCVKCHKLYNISWFTLTKKGENVKILLSIKSQLPCEMVWYLT